MSMLGLIQDFYPDLRSSTGEGNRHLLRVVPKVCPILPFTITPPCQTAKNSTVSAIFVAMKHSAWAWLWVVAFAALAGMSACSEKKAAEHTQAADSADAVPVADTFAVKLDTLMVHDTACKNSVFACTYVMLEVPDLGGTGAPPALASNLMRGIGLATGIVPDTAKRLPRLQNVAQAFVDSFTRELALYRKQDPEARIMPWFLEVRTQVAQKRSLVFLSTELFMFTGGVHPMMYNAYRAFDRQSGAPVSLDNLLQDTPAKAKLTALAEQKFRKQEGLSGKQGYNDYNFPDKKFALPANWRIQKDSLEFIYNLYEIKAYSAGFTTLKLPLSAVDSLLVPAYRAAPVL